ncbi:Uncharacterised protein [Mycobacteroides abscessus subsp. abscessus]|nr:Uncharacterised protein [Mycobacteroides abscessus subsp. abscessus]
MTRRTVAVAAVLVLALAVAGCGADHSTENKQGSTATAKTVPPGTADPCAGVVGCDEVAATDVDGDGTLDRVGLAVPADVKFGYPTTVTVVVSTGGEVKRVDAPSHGLLPGTGSGSPTDHARPYIGAYRISRVKGADLVLNTDMNQGSFGKYTIIGWQNNQPTLVNPPRPLASTSGSAAPSDWMLGPAEGQHRWVKCTEGAAVTATVLNQAYGDHMPPGGGLRQTDRFLFQDNDWIPNGSDSVPANGDEWLHSDQVPTNFDCQDQSGK